MNYVAESVNYGASLTETEAVSSAALDASDVPPGKMTAEGRWV